MNITSWWFQPSWKISVKMGIIPKIWVNIEHKKYLKPPPKYNCGHPKSWRAPNTKYLRSLNLRGNFEAVFFFKLSYIMSLTDITNLEYTKWLHSTEKHTKHHMVHPKQTAAISSQKIQIFCRVSVADWAHDRGIFLQQIQEEGMPPESNLLAALGCESCWFSHQTKGNQTQAPGIFVWSREAHSLSVLWFIWLMCFWFIFLSLLLLDHHRCSTSIHKFFPTKQ